MSNKTILHTHAHIYKQNGEKTQNHMLTVSFIPLRQSSDIDDSYLLFISTNIPLLITLCS